MNRRIRLHLCLLGLMSFAVVTHAGAPGPESTIPAAPMVPGHDGYSSHPHITYFDYSPSCSYAWLEETTVNFTPRDEAIKLLGPFENNNCCNDTNGGTIGLVGGIST